jgi:hypothetical protein
VEKSFGARGEGVMHSEKACAPGRDKAGRSCISSLEQSCDRPAAGVISPTPRRSLRLCASASKNAAAMIRMSRAKRFSSLKKISSVSRPKKEGVDRKESQNLSLAALQMG